ncbi:CD63 antigen-like [Rhodnius prolixus]|uniref:Tetraspanin n=1 Tax=Rhodnius prolixus TaxID=13249 RepID=R4G434_RHOPR
MGFCECSIKFVLFIFNLACALLGLVILGVSVVAHVHGKTFKTLLEGEITTTSIVMIVLGASVFIIAFFGCCGAIRDDSCMLTTYGVILSAILLVQVAIGILAFVYRGKFASNFEKEIEKTFDDYKNPEDMATINEIQKAVECCGLNGPDFWSSSKLPPSCCGLSDLTATCDRNHTFIDGCEPKIKTLIKQSFKLLGIIALSIAGIELICVIFAFCLSSSIKREQLRAYA